VLAQTGQITGRITDPGGAVVVGAKVTITETATGVNRAAETNTDGYYTAPSLQPGQYSISVDHPGFKPVERSGLQLQVDQTLRVDFTLEVGEISQKIVVQEQAPLLETETTSVGQVVQSNQIVNLPLLGRDPYALGGSFREFGCHAG
jgi:hypothetical protein